MCKKQEMEIAIPIPKWRNYKKAYEELYIKYIIYRKDAYNSYRAVNDLNNIYRKEIKVLRIIVGIFVLIGIIKFFL